MGSVYYLAHATGQEHFADADRLWAITLASIVASITLHGVTAGAALWRADLDASRRRPRRRWSATPA